MLIVKVNFFFLAFDLDFVLNFSKDFVFLSPAWSIIST